MKLLMPVLAALFSGLKTLTMIAVSPLALICSAGLVLLTYKIARQVRAQKAQDNLHLRGGARHGISIVSAPGLS
jgi:hypothetical protein